jgi:hypothetical protein
MATVEIQQPVPAHKELLSKEDFQAALQTQEKYVLIYAHIGPVPPQAEEYVSFYLITH